MRIRRRSFFGQLFLGFLAVMLTTNIVLFFYSDAVIRSYDFMMVSHNIERECTAMQAHMDSKAKGTLASDETFLRTISTTLDYRIWLLNSAGTVIYDTGNPDGGYNLSPESVKRALGGSANLTVTGSTHGESFLTYAVPVSLPGGGKGVMAVNSRVNGLNTAARDIEKTAFWRGLLVMLASILVAFYFTRKLTMPIQRLIRGTEEVGRGSYEKIVVEDTGNELLDLSVSFNDMITRLSEIEEEHRQLDTLKRDFLSDLSHELRTPLTTLEAFLEALKDGMVADEEHKRRYIVALYEETMHLKRLASDLLQLGRIESGHLVVEKVHFDPGEAIRGVADNRRDAAGEKANSLVLSLADEYPPIWCDRDHFRQIVTNLVNNAIQFTADGIITVEATVQDQFLRVSVADTGIGIDSRDLPFIWDRFFKVDKARARHHQESGLGLSIVKHLVEANHGRVGVESRPGEGSRFYFSLPLSGDTPAAAAGAAALGNGAPA